MMILNNLPNLIHTRLPSQICIANNSQHKIMLLDCVHKRLKTIFVSQFCISGYLNLIFQSFLYLIFNDIHDWRVTLCIGNKQCCRSVLLINSYFLNIIVLIYIILFFQKNLFFTLSNLNSKYINTINKYKTITH